MYMNMSIYTGLVLAGWQVHFGAHFGARFGILDGFQQVLRFLCVTTF